MEINERERLEFYPLTQIKVKEKHFQNHSTYGLE